MSPLASGPVQLAYAVADVDAAAHHWSRHYGAGPFFVRHHIEVSDVVVDGAPGSFDHSSAYGQWGSMMVELVAVHSPPSLAGAGLHHVAYMVYSFDEAVAELEADGKPQVLLARAGGTDFAFHDAANDLGHLIEIYQRSAGLTGFYQMVRDAADGWLGNDPVRTLD